ncbi:hemagglutinin repeat-containing protein, partial [Saccharibacter floricola]|uniref:hemagglutinin repeat-containing protein n=1 Tax=Saccharibacter floricola TaxID=231053 RepID=UPI00222E9BD5
SVGSQGWGASVEGSMQLQKQHVVTHSKTAVDSTLTASNQVSLKAHDQTTLDGAEVKGKRIDVDTGQLTITSPQNTSSYHSTSTQTGAQFSVPIPIPGTVRTDAGGGGSYEHQTVDDHYASTEKTLSGLYAGSDGLGVHVAGDTTLNAGVLSSTADKSKNQLTTGRLITHDVDNRSVWQATSIGGSASVGMANLGSTLG